MERVRGAGAAATPSVRNPTKVKYAFLLAPAKAGYISPQTFLLARSEYQYFRFGLGFTLMRDGYYAHELGDSWHGQDWDYDRNGVYVWNGCRAIFTVY